MTGVIVVRDGKGRKDRVVPVHPDLAAELRTWVLPDGARYIDITAGRLGRIPPRSSRSPATTGRMVVLRIVGADGNILRTQLGAH